MHHAADHRRSRPRADRRGARRGVAGRAAAGGPARLAQRRCPCPVDLSGEVKQFVIDHDRVVTLRRDDPRRPARRGRAWRQHDARAPVVGSRAASRRWSRSPSSTADDIDGTSPTRIWVVEVNGRSVGFVQDYRIGDYPDYALLTPTRTRSASTTRSASRTWVGRGLGVRDPVGLDAEDAGTDSPTRRPTSPPRTTATPPACGSSTSSASPQGVWFDEPEADGTVGDRRRLHPRRRTRAGLRPDGEPQWAMMCP